MLWSRHRVIIPDLRGHGRSRGLPPPYTAVQLASDLSLLLDHLGIESTAVLGYSQGGAIAQQLVLDYPQRFARLVLACTYAFNMVTFREKLEGRLVPLLVRVLGMRRFAKLVFSQGLTQIGRERADRLAGVMAGQNAQLMVSAWREAIAFDSRRRLTEIKRTACADRFAAAVGVRPPRWICGRKRCRASASRSSDALDCRRESGSG
jgi:3-oxoadipate enol-lactonase